VLVFKEHFGILMDYSFFDYNLEGSVQYNFDIKQISLASIELIKNKINSGLFFNYVINQNIIYNNFMPYYYNFGLLFKF